VLAHLPVNTSWTFDPLQIVPTILLAALYARRVRTLRARGTHVPAWRIASFATGIAVLFVALVSPIHAIGEQLFSFHMLQHVLLGDLAPLALLAGLTGPILRPALAYLYRLRFLANPFVALPLWAVNLYVWHLPFLYEAAVRHDSVHALEHLCFFTGGTIMWLPVLETLPAPEWFGTGAKIGYIAVVRGVETVLGNVFFWAGSVFYPAVCPQAAAVGALTARGSRPRGRGHDDRGLDRHARRARVALPTHGERGRIAPAAAGTWARPPDRQAGGSVRQSRGADASALNS